MVKESISKQDLNRLRSEVRKSINNKKSDNEKQTTLVPVEKGNTSFASAMANNYWSSTGMPWINSEGRKAVLTEWFWQPIRPASPGVLILMS